MVFGLNSFKPCYKWNTFNTFEEINHFSDGEWGFKPCYKWNTFNTAFIILLKNPPSGFKPCYKWNTFNTVNFGLSAISPK